MGILQHIPNSKGNPWRFAISLGVKYLSFSVDNFISFSSSGNSSMSLNTDSSYEEYQTQEICKIYSHILKEYFLHYQSDKDNSMFCLNVPFAFWFCSQHLNTWTCKKEINVAMRTFLIFSSSCKLYQYLMEQSKNKHLWMTKDTDST